VNGRTAPAGDETARGAGGPASPRSARAGRQLLRSGDVAEAIVVLERTVAAAPANGNAHAALARAYARAGRCEDALHQADHWVSTRAFDANLAILMRGCAVSLGRLEEALRYDRAGVDTFPENVQMATALAIDLAAAGDDRASADALDALTLVHPDRDASAFARAAIARLRGDVDAFDVEVALWERADRHSDEIARLRAEVLLDTGLPREALDAASRVAQVRAPLRVVRAEAHRRLGHLEAALAELGSAGEGPEADAVRVRVAVDLGDFESASRRLLQLDPANADVLAAAWYLARAEGRDRTELERAWRRAEPSRARSLSQLVPEDA
jgi:tetratricopeptide (TPR) repeat protein